MLRVVFASRLSKGSDSDSQNTLAGSSLTSRRGAKLVNRVVYRACERFTIGAAQRALDFHAPGGFDLRDFQEDGSIVHRERRLRDLQGVFVDVLGTVICAAFERPNFGGVVARIIGRVGGKRVGELNFNSIGPRAQAAGQVRRFARSAHAVEATIPLTIPRPRIQPAGVEMAVAGVKTPAHDSGRQVGNG